MDRGVGVFPPNGMNQSEEVIVEAIVGGSEEAVRLGRTIRRAREAKLWTQPQLVRLMREEAGRLSPGKHLPSDESWKAMLSRWEHGHRCPTPGTGSCSAALSTWIQRNWG